MFILPLGPGHKTPRFGFVGSINVGESSWKAALVSLQRNA